tara:strand:+ start:371 stop:664 length:294 start_codon:yes stop_codon:yes gene_type:complete
VRVEQLNRIQVRVHGDSMWPTLKDGDYVEAIQGQPPVVGDIVVVHHPFKKMRVIKRVKRILQEGVFIQGDNPDPIGSDDSHNFGPVPTSSIIAIIQD